LLGLERVSDPGDRIAVIDGVELDYGSNELAGTLRGIIKGNGNYLERVLGELVLGGDPELLGEARAVVTPVLSRRVSRHYGGFAMSQLKLFDTKPTAKRALFTRPNSINTFPPIAPRPFTSRFITIQKNSPSSPSTSSARTPRRQPVSSSPNRARNHKS